MDPTVIGTRLASSLVGPLVKKLFVQEGQGAGLVDRPVRLSSLVSFRGEKRTVTEKDLRKLAARLIQEAVDSPGEEPFPPDETTAVTDALTARLLALGDVDMDDVQAVRLGYRELARQLRYTASTRELSADATYFLDSLTEWACVHIVNFFTQRSTFVARTLVEQSRQLDEAVVKLDELITRNPRPDARDAAFERRYLAYVTKRHGHLTIYGVDLVNSPGKWPLDVAYLSLEATAPRVDWEQSIGSQEIADTLWLAATNQLASGVVPFQTSADQVLAHRDRVLLRGVAGSGKTTLVQWLAVSATRADADGPMSHLYGRIPLVLPLRTLTRHGERLPAPDAFLRSSGCSLAGAQPEGWADRVLEHGRGLVLIDGIDEIPEPERDGARTWLSELITAYPDNRWLVTSRPSAVRDDWLTDDGFTELTLSAMSPTAVATFIAHWHRAAATGNAREDAELGAFERQLLVAIRSKPDLSRLATNPLMCGLICALHRDRRGYLPYGRKELYEAALTMLLTRRDRERDIATTNGVELQQEPQTQLLQRLAYWLIRNGRTELDRTRAEQIIADALPAVPSAAALGDAWAVFRHLLDRSGLLREPAPGAVDFIHRTFQDYLGARAAVDVWDIGLLIEHAADDQWEDVIRMAVAHARPRERAEILRGLSEKGDACEAGRERSRIHLLAAACLEHAAELDPAVRGAVEERAGALMPPTSAKAAEELAAVGPLVLDLLPGPEGLSDQAAVAVVTTAAYVASDAAIPYLARFADHPTVHVRSLLASHWEQFDTDQYAREVLARIRPDGVVFRVADAAQLQVLKALGGRPVVRFRGSLPQHQMAEYLAQVPPTELFIGNHAELTDLSVLTGATAVSHLSVSNCPRLTDLSGLTATTLETLSLLRIGPGLNLGPIRTLDRLRDLSLGLSATDEWSMAVLPAEAPLRALRVGHRSPAPDGGLIGLGRCRKLRVLQLGPATSPSSATDWSEIESLPELTALEVSATSLALCSPTTTLPSLTRLTINVRGDEPVTLERLASLSPALMRLHLTRTPRATSRPDLTPLKDLPALQWLRLQPGSDWVHGLGQLPTRIQVTTM